jgi:hypothetical protein
MKRLVCLAICAWALFGVLESQAPAAIVKGTVTPTKWAQEVEVCAFFRAQLSEQCAVPKADGSYSYAGIVGSVTFEFIPTYRSGLLTQYYDHKDSLLEASYLEFEPNEVQEGINADLTEGGRITGVVTTKVGGAQLAEIEVCAVSISLPTTVKSCEETDSGGEYDLHSLPTGFYVVRFNGQGRSGGYQPAFYEDRSPLAVTAGQVKTGIDVALTEGARIGGKVFGAGGVPSDGVAVCLFAVPEANAQQCTESSEGGNYSFLGLPDGSYQVGFSLEASEIGGSGTKAGADGYQSQYYNGVATRAQAVTISLVAPETVEGVDATLRGFPVTPPPAIALAVGNPLAPPPTVSSPEPKPREARCKKPRHKAEIKGKVVCMNPVKHKKAKKHGKPSVDP